jgi:hypothetical protein
MALPLGVNLVKDENGDLLADFSTGAGETHEKSVILCGVSAEIRSELLPDTCLERFCYINHLARDR